MFYIFAEFHALFKNVAHPTPPFPFPLKIGKIYSKKSKLTTYVILVFLEKEFDIPQMCFFIPKSLQEKCQNRKEFLGIMLKVAGLRMFAYIFAEFYALFQKVAHPIPPFPSLKISKIY